MNIEQLTRINYLYNIPSGLGGSFTVKYMGVIDNPKDDRKHHYRVTNKGWAQGIYLTDQEVAEKITEIKNTNYTKLINGSK